MLTEVDHRSQKAQTFAQEKPNTVNEEFGDNRIDLPHQLLLRFHFEGRRMTQVGPAFSLWSPSRMCVCVRVHVRHICVVYTHGVQRVCVCVRKYVA